MITHRNQNNTIEYPVYSLYLDPSDIHQFKKLLTVYTPSIVIYAAGCKDLPMCELNSQDATNINAVYPSLLSQIYQPFVYISTDYVFDGTSGQYNENSQTNPTTVYGQTKRQGEVTTYGHIIRTGGLYNNHHYPTWVKWLRSMFKTTSDTVTAYSNVYNTPTHTYDLATSILELIQEPPMIYHVTGKDKINRYDLLTLYARHNGFDYNRIIHSESDHKDLSLTSIKYPLQRGVLEFI